MRIYTRRGDAGETDLIGGVRVSKANAAIEAVGSLDEANCALGVARAAGVSPATDDLLERAQTAILAAGAEVAQPQDRQGTPPAQIRALVEALERSIDEMTEALPPLRNFILPGGCAPGASLHMARAVCRRAERQLVALSGSAPVGHETLAFFNRLSDWLFTAARYENHLADRPEAVWRPHP